MRKVRSVKEYEKSNEEASGGKRVKIHFLKLTVNDEVGNGTRIRKHYKRKIVG